MPGVIPLHLLDPAALRARVTRRSYWAVRFTDGRIIAEWDRDWIDLPRKGRQSIRLYCPNGQVGELGNSEDATDRIFQFKQSLAGAANMVLCHVVGIIHGTDGQCTCYAWEPTWKRLVQFEDNANNMKYGNVGRLAGPHLGIKAD